MKFKGYDEKVEKPKDKKRDIKIARDKKMKTQALAYRQETIMITKDNIIAVCDKCRELITAIQDVQRENADNPDIVALCNEAITNAGQPAIMLNHASTTQHQA